METLLWGRMVERIIIAVAATAAMAMGWNLFRVGILQDQNVEVQKGDVKLKLRRVAPGVMFALFGAVVLVFAIVTRAEITLPNGATTITNSTLSGDPRTQPPDTGRAAVSSAPTSAVYASGLGVIEDPLLQRALALNTVLENVRETSVPNNGNIGVTAYQEILRVHPVLTDMRNELVVARLGYGALRLWNEWGTKFLQDPQNVPEVHRSLLQQLTVWMTGKFPTDTRGEN